MSKIKNYFFTAFFGLFLFIPAICLMLLMSLLCPAAICGTWRAIFWIPVMAGVPTLWIVFWVKFLEWYKETYKD
jgi:hypothetical protein